MRVSAPIEPEASTARMTRLPARCSRTASRIVAGGDRRDVAGGAAAWRRRPPSPPGPPAGGRRPVGPAAPRPSIAARRRLPWSRGASRRADPVGRVVGLARPGPRRLLPSARSRGPRRSPPGACRGRRTGGAGGGGPGRGARPGGRRRPWSCPALQAGEGGRGPADHQVGPQALGAHRRAQRADPCGPARRAAPPAGRRRKGSSGHARGEGGRVGVEGHAPAHGLGPLGRVGRRQHVGGQAEAVEQLGPQVALLGVHGPDEHEPAGVGVADALPLDPVDAGHGHVEQDVDQVVGQQVDLVDVEHAAVGRGQQTGREADLAAGQGRGQVDGADQAVLGRPDGQLDERRVVGEQSRPGPGPGWSWPSPSGPAAARRRWPARRRPARSASLASSWPTTAPEREPPFDCGGHRLSSQPSASSSAERSVARASGEASHRPRSLASSSRSAMERRAHGFDCSNNLRTAGSAT